MSGRVGLSLLVFLQFCAKNLAYEIPDVNIEAFTPKGFRVSLPDAPDIALFVFQGNINQPIQNNDVGKISAEVTKATNGRWVYEDPNLQLKVGDVINYFVFVSVRSAGFIKDKLSYTVGALVTRSELPPPSNPAPTVSSCPLSVTKLREGTCCVGQTIFEDDFETLREDMWQIQQYVPVDHPEFPFVSYQRLENNPTVSVVNGNLRIAPKLQQNLPGYSEESIYDGYLDLRRGCRSRSEKECYYRASGAAILPPVVTGRVTSRGFAFTYGTVHIRAKLPQGDWLYPEILLEPFIRKYGEFKFASGVLKIATARGNKDLKSGIADFGNKVLYGGPVMDATCRQLLIDTKKLTNGRMWGDDFHIYTLNWTPDRIALLVDNEEWASLEPPPSGLRTLFPPDCSNLPSDSLATGSKMAPFDDHFYITFGVAAGGITDFNDDLFTTGNAAKPWRNSGSKASLNFWKAMSSWYPTWNSSELLIDYVKVVAL